MPLDFHCVLSGRPAPCVTRSKVRMALKVEEVHVAKIANIGWLIWLLYDVTVCLHGCLYSRVAVRIPHKQNTSQQVGSCAVAHQWSLAEKPTASDGGWQWETEGMCQLIEAEEKAWVFSGGSRLPIGLTNIWPAVFITTPLMIAQIGW